MSWSSLSLQRKAQVARISPWHPECPRTAPLFFHPFFANLFLCRLSTSSPPPRARALGGGGSLQRDGKLTHTHTHTPILPFRFPFTKARQTVVLIPEPLDGPGSTLERAWVTLRPVISTGSAVSSATLQAYFGWGVAKKPVPNLPDCPAQLFARLDDCLNLRLLRGWELPLPSTRRRAVSQHPQQHPSKAWTRSTHDQVVKQQEVALPVDIGLAGSILA